MDDQSSTFKNALSHVVVPSVLEEGVSVLRVKVNGSMRQTFLTLSQDRFTLYITSSKVSGGSGGGGSGKSFFSFGRSGSSSHSRSNSSSASSTAAMSEMGESVQEHSIDIGAIDRIQRGQVTHKFELAK